MTEPMAFVDLAAQYQRVADSVQRRITAVLAHGRYIMGPEVAELENELASRAGVSHAVTCSSGTDALLMVLLALGVGPGDGVVVPAFTFAATAEVVSLAGASPVFADVDPDTFLLTPGSVAAAVAAARAAGLNPRAVIVVDLFGQPVDPAAIAAVTDAEGLFVLADAAQSFGGSHDGRPVGSLAPATATSFFPAKPLGCYGDGGAVFTDNGDLADALRSIRVHGQGADKYENVRVGLNARLDTIQAAVLLAKLEVFDDELVRRDEVAARYRSLLPGHVRAQVVVPPARSAWAQFTICLEHRDAVAAGLAESGIPTAVYYPAPLHRQGAYHDAVVAKGGAPVAERLSSSVLSLPMHPYLSPDDQERACTALAALVARMH